MRPTYKYNSVSRSVVSNSLWPHELWSARLLCPWSSALQARILEWAAISFSDKLNNNVLKVVVLVFSKEIQTLVSPVLNLIFDLRYID